MEVAGSSESMHYSDSIILYDDDNDISSRDTL